VSAAPTGACGTSQQTWEGSCHPSWLVSNINVSAAAEAVSPFKIVYLTYCKTDHTDRWHPLPCQGRNQQCGLSLPSISWLLRLSERGRG
jgi:hypothetical protein